MTFASGPDRPTEDPIAARVSRLIQDRYDGNAAAAARSLGLGARLIQRVIRDGQAPPARLLAALASLDGVDPAWLLTGKSGPGPTVPLFDRLLPAPLATLDLPQWQMRVPAHPDVARPTVYAYRIPLGHSLIQAKDLRIQVGDILYIESAPYVGHAVGTAAEPHRLVVWRYLGTPNDRIPVTYLGEVKKTGETCMARIFADKTQTYPYHLSEAKKSKQLENPLPPGPDDVLGPNHIAGVVIALARIDLFLVEKLQRI